MKKKVNNVCVIDDDLIYQYLAKEEIDSTNLVENVIFFNNGEKAIKYLSNLIESENTKGIPEIIFLDLNMPVMDGWEFLEAFVILKPKLPKKITIYVVSSSIDSRDLNRAKAINEVSDFIIKPITGNRLKEIFLNLL